MTATTPTLRRRRSADADQGANVQVDQSGCTPALVRPASFGCALPGLPDPVERTGDTLTIDQYRAWEETQ